MVARMNNAGAKTVSPGADFSRDPGRHEGDAFARSRRFAGETPTAEFLALEGWVRGHLGKIKHEHRVVAIASTLFDMMRPLHRLDARARRLLCAAALVHDVGRATAGRAGHPASGSRMILSDAPLSGPAALRRQLAYLTLYHRDAVPEAGREQILLPGDDRRSLLIVLALLRAADALDSRSKESPRLVLSISRRTLKIACYLKEYSAKVEKLYRRRKKFRLLEDILHCTVIVRVQCGEAVGVVGVIG